MHPLPDRPAPAPHSSPALTGSATVPIARLPPDVAALLARLDPEQRAAATAPPGPVLCVAPAGSGKTTTLVARVAFLVATGSEPAGVCAVAFNRKAAQELDLRLADALAPLGVAPGTVRVRTFHALGREILVDAGQPVEPLVDRTALLRRLFPDARPADRRRLDDAFSRLKLEHGVGAAEVAADPAPGSVGSAFLAYERAIAELGGLDFDDLVVRSLRMLESDPALLDRWRSRCADLLVDEVQDVDRTQLRLALLLAAPANGIFLVGDDDQSIYGWRLADVRRVLGLASALPGLRRVDLATNYRCPAPVVERAVRLIGHNRERFAKRIVARPGAGGRLVLGPDPSEPVERVRRVLDHWPDDGGTRAILARTNRELLPALAVALERGLAFRAPDLPTPLASDRLETVLATAEATDPSLPLLLRVDAARRRLEHEGGPVATPAHATAPGGVEPDPEPNSGCAVEPDAGRSLGPAGADGPDWLVREPNGPEWPERRQPVRASRRRDGVREPNGPEWPERALDHDPEPHGPDRDDDPDHPDDPEEPALAQLADALLAWAPAYPDLPALAGAVRERRRRLLELGRPDAPLTLATAHATKGLEFDHVALVAMDADAFPSARTLAEAADPARALEEERRLAYVAWTRARRSLTLVYDPSSPSRFLLEAFTPAELGVTPEE